MDNTLWKQYKEQILENPEVNASNFVQRVREAFPMFLLFGDMCGNLAYVLSRVWRGEQDETPRDWEKCVQCRHFFELLPRDQDAALSLDGRTYIFKESTTTALYRCDIQENSDTLLSRKEFEGVGSCGECDFQPVKDFTECEDILPRFQRGILDEPLLAEELVPKASELFGDIDDIALCAGCRHFRQSAGLIQCWKAEREVSKGKRLKHEYLRPRRLADGMQRPLDCPRRFLSRFLDASRSFCHSFGKRDTMRILANEILFFEQEKADWSVPLRRLCDKAERNSLPRGTGGNATD